MLKTYLAQSEVCINVTLGSHHVHLAFQPFTLGGSSFTTDDPELQEAIERHRHFGSRIRLKPSSQPPQLSSPSVACQPREKTFYSLNDAKEYAADQWGISRTMLRTREQVEATFRAHHIKMGIHP